MTRARPIAMLALLLLGVGVMLAIAGVRVPALFLPGVFVTGAALVGLAVAGVLLVLPPKAR